jgi:hypothetical protein
VEGGLSGIDWSAPRFAPWREPGQAAARLALGGMPVHAALNQAALGQTAPRPHQPPVRFVPPQALVPGEPYEGHVFRTGDCPTRDNLHDFFNGLVWLRLPRAKQRLNDLHQAQIELAAREAALNPQASAVRGPVRDAITLFDENGALLHAPAPLWEALLARRWVQLFVELRPLWAQARLLVFGHALLEKLVTPRKDLTAHVWRAPVPPEHAQGWGQGADTWLAGRLDAQGLASKPFTPLPLMGVPGWCRANAEPAYYDDVTVFRPPRPPAPRPDRAVNPLARSDIA